MWMRSFLFLAAFFSLPLLANNGPRLPDGLKSPFTTIESYWNDSEVGLCGGTFVSEEPHVQVLSAAHCFIRIRPMAPEQEELLPGVQILIKLFPRLEKIIDLIQIPKKIRVALAAKKELIQSPDDFEWTTITEPAEIHPGFLRYLHRVFADQKAAHNFHDLALLNLAHDIKLPKMKLPDGKEVPAKASFAFSSPAEDHPVKVVGWGFTLPHGDYDNDGVDNQRDPCPTTLPEKRKLARTSAIPGCVDEEPWLDLSFAFRGGMNRVYQIRDDGRIGIRRQLKPGKAGKDIWFDRITPGGAESGSALLNHWNGLVGVVMSSEIRREREKKYHYGFYIDLKIPRNEDWLNTHVKNIHNHDLLEEGLGGLKLVPPLKLELDEETEER